MSEHLPIQRWAKVFTRYPASEVLPNENGEYVTYADHLNALRAREEQVEESMGRWWEKFSRDQFDAGYSAGYKKAVADAQWLLEEHVDSTGWVALTKMTQSDG